MQKSSILPQLNSISYLVYPLFSNKFSLHPPIMTRFKIHAMLSDKAAKDDLIVMKEPDVALLIPFRLPLRKTRLLLYCFHTIPGCSLVLRYEL